MNYGKIPPNPPQPMPGKKGESVMKGLKPRYPDGEDPQVKIEALTKENAELRAIVDCPDIFKANEEIAKLQKKCRAIGYACLKHDLVHGFVCPVCYREMEAKNKALMELLERAHGIIGELSFYSACDPGDEEWQKDYKALQGEK